MPKSQPKSVFAKRNARLRVQAANRRSYYRWRNQALSALGGQCVHCGITDVEVLTFDHIAGDGDAEIRRRGSKGLRTRDFRDIATGRYSYSQVQLLCANCHLKKTRKSRDFRVTDERQQSFL